MNKNIIKIFTASIVGAFAGFRAKQNDDNKISVAGAVLMSSVMFGVIAEHSILMSGGAIIALLYSREWTKTFYGAALGGILDYAIRANINILQGFYLDINDDVDPFLESRLNGDDVAILSDHNA